MQQFKQLRQQLLDPVSFTTLTGTVKGKPFSFEGRPHLMDIYRDPHPRVVLLSGRQVEKSETVNRKLLFHGFTRAHTTITYTAPRAEQTTRFVNDRFRKSINESVNSVLEHSVDKKRDAKTAIRLTNKSIYYFGSSWSDGDALRGISGDIVCFDEVQDITQTAIESIEKSVSHSEIRDEATELNGKCFYAGTPKQAGSYFDRVLWGQSDQKKWQVICRNCSHKQFLSMKNIMEDATKQGRRYFGCLNCFHELDRQHGRWVATRPENKMYSGYHLSQLMMSWISGNQIWRDYLTMDTMTFTNEVLGEFYSGAEQPITIEDVLACCNRGLSLKSSSSEPTVMGIDYGSGGSSKTIITIGHKSPEGKLVIDYIENCRIDNHEELVAHIATLKHKFQVAKIVGDIGYGSYEAQKLYQLFGRDALACRYVTYHTEPSKREYKGDYTLQVDRTYSMDKTIELFKKRLLEIPYRKPAEVEGFFDHYTALELKFTESATSTGKKLYTHTLPDDAFHSLNLLREGIYELENRFEWEGIERNTGIDKLFGDFDSLPNENNW